MAVIEIKKENFEKEVLNSDKRVLVDFWASWCGPCRMLMPVVHEVADEQNDFKVASINIDEQEELAIKYNVMTIPTLMVFENGKVINKSVGVIPKPAIYDLVK